MNETNLTKLFDKYQIAYRQNISGKSLTNLKIGGNLSLLLEPSDTSELLVAIRQLLENQISYKVIGAGSNLLIPDNGVVFPVIKLPKSFRNYQEIGSGVFQVFAAMPLMKLSTELSRLGYSGLEFAGGIPASFGGAIKMNAGAHGGEMSEVVQSVDLISSAGERITLTKDEMKFSYRHSVISDQDIVISATIKLTKGSQPEKVLELQQQNLAYRKKTQPLTVPSAGSIFKNPLPRFAGQLIEESGLKGHECGGAAISSLHANWIVNESKLAKAQDVQDLIALIQAKVAENYQIALQSELVIWP